MTDQLTHDLTSLFATTATDAEIPPLPLPQVVAQGRSLQQARRRRTALWSAAAAAVAVVAVTLPVAIATHGGGHDDRPAPAHHTSPTPDSGIPTTATTLPYLDGKVVHFNDRTVTLDAKPNAFVSHGDTTLFWDSKTDRWWRVWAKDGSVEQFGPPRGSNERPWEGWFQPTISADGHTIAVLTHPTQDSSRITEYDADGQEKIGHVDLDQPFSNWTGGGDSVTLTHVTNSGQAIWNQMDKTSSWWVWKPSMKAPVRIDRDLYGVGDPPNGAIAANGAPVAFTPQGRIEPATGHVYAHPEEALWSPRGTVEALADRGRSASITTISADVIAQRSPPAAYTILKWFGFESESYVIGAAAVDHTPASLVRCSTQRSACAVIGELPTDWESWQWATSPPTDTATDPVADGASTTSADPIAALPQGAAGSGPLP